MTAKTKPMCYNGDMKAADFLQTLEAHGFNFFTGVHCSYFLTLCHLLAERKESQHVPALREDIALGLASGAYLAGKLPVVYMQNSGLGYSLEVFASLPLIYHIPSLVLVSLRGPEDPDMEEHVIMGRYTEDILETFQLKYAVFPGEMGHPEIGAIKDYLLKEELPYILLFKKGALT